MENCRTFVHPTLMAKLWKSLQKISKFAKITIFQKLLKWAKISKIFELNKFSKIAEIAEIV